MSAVRRDVGPPPPARRKGWCPGALRPMETGDGLLVRVRLRAGGSTLDQAAVIADCAARAFGNGAIELSARANLQFAGFTRARLPGLHARLASAGLFDDDPEVERLRNIVASPLSDIDPNAAARSSRQPRGARGASAADATMRATCRRNSVSPRRWRPVRRLAMSRRTSVFQALRAAMTFAFCASQATTRSRALCARADIGRPRAASLARGVCHADAASRPCAARRMRALVEHIGAPAVFAQAGLRAGALAAMTRRAAEASPAAASRRSHLGAAYSRWRCGRRSA